MCSLEARSASWMSGRLALQVLHYRAASDDACAARLHLMHFHCLAEHRRGAQTATAALLLMEKDNTEHQAAGQAKVSVAVQLIGKDSSMVKDAVSRSRAAAAVRLLEVESKAQKATARSTAVAVLRPRAKGSMAQQAVSRSEAATALRLMERISLLQEAMGLSKAMVQMVTGNKVRQAAPQAQASSRSSYAAAVATSSGMLAMPMYGAPTTAVIECRTRMQQWETTCHT